MRSPLAASVGAAGVLAALAVITLINDRHYRTVSLLGRSDALAEKLGMDESVWGSGQSPPSLTDNLGSNNMEIAKTIKGLHALRDQPNLAAALHGLERSVQASSNAIEDLNQGFVTRIQRMRAHSSYCRAHPLACKNLAPAWPGDAQGDEAPQFPPARSAAEHSAAAKGRTMALFGGNVGIDEAGGQEKEQFGGVSRATDDGDMSRVEFVDAPPRAAGNPGPALDPMWCGASHCADRGYAAAQMAFKQRHRASTQALASWGAAAAPPRSAAYQRTYQRGAAIFRAARSRAAPGLERIAWLRQVAQQRLGHQAGAAPARVPRMKGVDMSVVAAERVRTQLREEEGYQQRQQAAMNREMSRLSA